MSKIGQYVSNTLTTVTASDLNGLTTLPTASFVYKTALTSATIPSGVTYIGGSAFEGCTNLSTLSLPDTITEISTNAFYNSLQFFINIHNINGFYGFIGISFTHHIGIFISIIFHK